MLYISNKHQEMGDVFKGLARVLNVDLDDQV